MFTGDKLSLMSQKGVYPYDYMDCFEKFNQTERPTKELFYGVLNDQHITNGEYDHARKVWETFNLKNMGEYHGLYLKSDVLLLAVFESFRNVDMFQFIDKGMRAGVSYIGNRYGKANNKYTEEFDENAPSKYIMYLDAKNLYGWAMSQYLPTGNFRWMTDKETNKIDLGKYKADGKKRLILDVDLEYPRELHDLIMTILFLQKKQKYPKICYRGIVKRLLKNIRFQLAK